MLFLDLSKNYFIFAKIYVKMKLIKVFLICFGFLAQAQNSFEIKGRVLSENEVFPYVSVYVKGTSIGTTASYNK